MDRIKKSNFPVTVEMESIEICSKFYKLIFQIIILQNAFSNIIRVYFCYWYFVRIGMTFLSFILANHSIVEPFGGKCEN